jgi:GTP-binding protein LepA
VKREIEEVIGLDCSHAILASAKQGIGIQEILEEVVRRVPPPKDNRGEALRALIFDSYYDAYKVRGWCVVWWVGVDGVGRQVRAVHRGWEWLFAACP